ncbi:MAG: hypothetical protein AAGF49_02240 [Pseudomonadota bacterium]
MVEMTDFYSVLQRAVASLPDSSGPNRRAVYDKARKALLKQLQSFDPPLPSSDVTAQRLALEDAIRKIENEIARQIRTQRAMQTAMPAPGAQRPRPGLPNTRSGGAEAAAAARLAEEERAAQRAAEAERARKQQAELLRNAVSEATEGPQDHPGALPAPPVPVSRPPTIQAADYDEYETDERAMFEEEADYDQAPHHDDVAATHPDIVDGEYDEVDEEFAHYDDEADAVASDSREQKKRQKQEQRARKEEERRLKAERRSQRRDERKAREPVRKRKAAASGGKAGRRIVLGVVLLLLFGGAGYAVFTQGEALLSTIDQLREDQTDRPPITVTGVGSEKNSDRLPSTLDGEDTRAVTTTPWPPRDGAVEAQPDAAPTQAPEGATESQAAPPPDRTVGTEVSPFVAETPAPEAAAVPDQPPADTPAAEPQRVETAAVESAPTPPQDTGPIAEFTASGTQQAVLYEEAAQVGEQGAAIAGGVEWSMVRQSIGGADPEPVIRATAEIPERQMTATLTVRENQDGALPASHLIEIAFEVPDGFQGGGVKNVPGVIMKENEQSRGEALRGAAARVSSGLFWIALSETASDRASNLALLRERDWIDVPILYENGRRAILTLRKGDDGFQSVNAAIRAWEAGERSARSTQDQ